MIKTENWSQSITIVKIIIGIQHKKRIEVGKNENKDGEVL